MARLLPLLLLPLFACEERPAPPAESSVRPRNVIVVLADTLRADHMSLYGYGRDTTPRISALAESAVVFERARSQSACTFPSVNSLLTSRHPARFFHQGYQHYGIPPEVSSIAELLGAKGYATFATSASAVVRATPSRHNKVGGFQRGFDVFDESCLSKPAACINRQAFAFLASAREPFVAYLHYMDPHAPYTPPRQHRRRWARRVPADLAPDIANGETRRVEKTVFKLKRPDLVPANVVRHLMDLYDEEIAYFDGQLGALFDWLEHRGLLDDTIVVLAADHGEEFLEHDSFAHCRTLYDTETHVPLVMWIPGVRATRIATPVANLDVVPTVFDYLGAEPSSDFEGESLRPLIEGRDAGTKRVVHSLQSNLRSADDGRFKLIYDIGDGRREAYDLIADAGEKNDIAARPREELAGLERQLHDWIRENEQALAEQHGKGYGKRIEQSLRALGYLE